ncbi:MAG: acyltransferase [Bacteroidales bacterium]|nr:acyltransferase [Bacteroidales bacterium]
MEQNFDEIRPYTDAEIPAAAQRVADSPYLPAIVNYLFPGREVGEFQQIFRNLHSIHDFQDIVMYPAIRSIIEKTSSGFSTSGFESLHDNRKRMFISNHRDILLDAAILQTLLVDHGLDTSEITFGSNLMNGELVVDIGKMNKMFRIMRGGHIRDFYQNSMHVSSYMRYAIVGKQQSVWIAQRNGRTKDGDDRTDMAVLKMFALSSDKDFVDNLSELNITPMVVSYEYEPCDFMKTQEIFISRYQKYEKEPGEDLNSILHGIKQFKGHIHFAIAPAITVEDLNFCDRFERNKKFQHLAGIIDKRVYLNYKLWPTNYIAYELLNQTYKYKDQYTQEEMDHFVEYMEQGLSSLVGDPSELREIFLGIYANPVVNYEQLFV